jgi:hypothetical protein
LISIIARIGAGISKDSLTMSKHFSFLFICCKSVNKIPQNWIYFLNFINQIEWMNIRDTTCFAWVFAFGTCRATKGNIRTESKQWCSS